MIRLMSVALIAVMMVGCGSELPSPSPVFPVTGTGTLGGQPVVGADVTFFNAEKKRSAFSQTDEEGNYSLMTFALNDGAVEGNHVVTIAKYAPPAPAPVDVDVDSEDYEPPKEGYDAPPPKGETQLNPKYADAATSGLTATVTEAGPNVFDFEL